MSFLMKECRVARVDLFLVLMYPVELTSKHFEPGLMTIFVTWQLIVTLDSIRNSCDVWKNLFRRGPGGSHLTGGFRDRGIQILPF